jgi:hypothetical protein
VSRFGVPARARGVEVLEIARVSVARWLLFPSGMRNLLVLAVLARAAAAHANSCDTGGLHLAVGDVPLGCPVVVLMQSFGTNVPKVTTIRGGTVVDLTGTITPGPDVQVPIETYRYHDDCELHDDGIVSRPYQSVGVALVGAQVGDLLVVDGSYDDADKHVVAAGPCPDVVPPMLSCADPIQTCADGGIDAQPVAKGGGCSTGGSASPLALLALLGRRQDRLRDRLRRILGRVMPGRR